MKCVFIMDHHGLSWAIIVWLISEISKITVRFALVDYEDEMCVYHGPSWTIMGHHSMEHHSVEHQ